MPAADLLRQPQNVPDCVTRHITDRTCRCTASGRRISVLEQPVNDIANQHQSLSAAQQRRPHVDTWSLSRPLIEKLFENFLSPNRSSPRRTARGIYSVGRFASISQHATETERQQARAGVIQVRERRTELTPRTARP